MKSLAFIPARGGSKRLPGKNIKLFCGKPLIYYSIAFAQHNRISKVIVSTDDDEIAAVAATYGAEILRRPIELSSDEATTGAAANHCLLDQRAKGFEPDIFVTLQPTNPLRPLELFQEALKIWDSTCDSVISVAMNRHKFGTIEDGYYNPLNYSPGIRSQDLKLLYHENGLIYLTHPSVIEKSDIFGSKTKTLLTDEISSLIDIDTELDFELGEHIMKIYSGKFSYLF